MRKSKQHKGNDDNIVYNVNGKNTKGCSVNYQEKSQLDNYNLVKYTRMHVGNDK